MYTYILHVTSPPPPRKTKQRPSEAAVGPETLNENAARVQLGERKRRKNRRPLVARHGGSGVHVETAASRTHPRPPSIPSNGSVIELRTAHNPTHPPSLGAHRPPWTKLTLTAARPFCAPFGYGYAYNVFVFVPRFVFSLFPRFSLLGWTALATFRCRRRRRRQPPSATISSFRRRGWCVKATRIFQVEEMQNLQLLQGED